MGIFDTSWQGLKWLMDGELGRTIATTYGTASLLENFEEDCFVRFER